MKTDTSHPDYYARNVDCQHACPTHTNVPEYIRLVAEGRYEEAYFVNRASNVFPGILGRVCDRPCEPACRRGRLKGEEPVAICRLKRVAADLKGDIAGKFFRTVGRTNGKRVALIGAGPASLTVANDLLPLGYEVTVFEKESSLGGAMRRAVPAFRLPEAVLEEEIGFIVSMGLQVKTQTEVTKLSEIAADFDAVFVGTGAPVGRDLALPGRDLAGEKVQVGLKWLAAVSFGHVKAVGARTLVIGGGNTAMDCCRTALRLGAKEVMVAAPETFEAMLALPWERDDAKAEGVKFFNQILPTAFETNAGLLAGVRFDRLRRLHDEHGGWAPEPVPGAELFVACDEVILAIGQRAAYDFVDSKSGVSFNAMGLPAIDTVAQRAGQTAVFFGGDAAFGPKNIVTAVAQGHEAATSIHALLSGLDPAVRPQKTINLTSQKMGLHEWSYGNAYSADARLKVPHLEMNERFKTLSSEVELGFDAMAALKEAERCLNCDVQTVFSTDQCIECDACIDICPTDCLTLTQGGADSEVKLRLRAPFSEPGQNFFQSERLKTGRIMAKDENVCLHCGLCAERCPTGAWDMQKSIVSFPKAGDLT